MTRSRRISGHFVVMMFAITHVVAGCGSASAPGVAANSNGSALAPMTAGHVMLVVHGMGCPLCANNVDKQLLAVRGVEAVSVDLGTGRVAVRIGRSASVSRGDLSRAVERSGYTLVRVEEGGGGDPPPLFTRPAAAAGN